MKKKWGRPIAVFLFVAVFLSALYVVFIHHSVNERKERALAVA